MTNRRESSDRGGYEDTKMTDGRKDHEKSNV
jgi:hypothetical protein